ncbi:hypothetical protein ACMGGS_18755 [Superficieibacter sp. BNK-5]|uniref:hypothetical protein n=1 Tax=Superficieibacter sp. BNK-5 TaxID=3376142 RepID=UPI0029028F79|nr:hypothetical protein [Enterobacteriaceae bacterium]
MTKSGMSIEAAKAELQAAMSGPAGRHWNYGPAVSAVLEALEQAERRVAELEAHTLSVKLPQPLQVSLDFSLIRRALSNVGIAAPETDEDLGSTHIRQILKFVSEQEAT